MTNEVSAGSEGGAASEAGGEYRRAVAALFAAHGLNGLPIQGLPIAGDDATVEAVALESDLPVDDVVVQLRGGRLLLQAKRTLRFGRPLHEVTEQWLRAVRDPDFDPPTDRLAAAAGSLSQPIEALARALDRRRQGAENYSRREQEALDRLRVVVEERGALDSEVELILSGAVVLPLRVEEALHEDAERGRLLLDGHVVPKGQGTRAWRELVSIAGEAARFRIGHSVAAWLEELRKRDVPLTVDSEASRSAHLERRRQAVNRYRERRTARR